MTTTSKPTTLAVGDVFHALTSGTTLYLGGPESVVLHRGDVVTVTSEALAASVDRHGNSNLAAVLRDPQRFAPGPAPEGMQRWVRGDPEWAQARHEAHAAAWAIHTGRERGEALREVERVYGPAATTSRTTNSAAGSR